MKQLIPFHKEIVFRTMIGEITSISLEHTLSFENETTIRGDFIVSGTYKMTEASQIEEDFDYHLPVDIEISDHYDVKNSKIDIDDFYYEIINDEILKVNIDVLLDGVEPVIEIIEEKDISLDEDVIKSHLEKEPVRHSKEEIEQEKSSVEDIISKDTIKEEVSKKEEIREETNLTQTVRDEMIDNEIPILQAEEPSLEQILPNKEVVKKEEKVIEVKQAKEEPASIDSIFSAFKDTDETFSTYSVYIVRENDTLEGIMDRYHCNREELSNYNNLEDLTLGTKLIIPCSVSKDV